MDFDLGNQIRAFWFISEDSWEGRVLDLLGSYQMFSTSLASLWAFKILLAQCHRPYWHWTGGVRIRKLFMWFLDLFSEGHMDGGALIEFPTNLFFTSVGCSTSYALGTYISHWCWLKMELICCIRAPHHQCAHFQRLNNLSINNF